jgi:CRISPR type III-B/RAMP module-associated protein Cmr3
MGFAFAADAWVQQPEKDDPEPLAELALLRFGGEARLARIARPDAPQPLWEFPPLPQNRQGTRIVAWTLVSPAVFAHGALPGWLRDTRKEGTPRPVGEVCLRLTKGRAWLAGCCAVKPVVFSGWDLADAAPNPTQLAVPAGSVYTFVAENADSASELASLLHARPRSDAYGEKGFGYGLCRFVGGVHPAAEGGLNGLIGEMTQ